MAFSISAQQLVKTFTSKVWSRRTETCYTRRAERHKQLADRKVAMQQLRKAIQPGRIDVGHWRVKALVLAIASIQTQGSWRG